VKHFLGSKMRDLRGPEVFTGGDECHILVRHRKLPNKNASQRCPSGLWMCFRSPTQGFAGFALGYRVSLPWSYGFEEDPLARASGLYEEGTRSRVGLA
jgi:hypothetical protein